MSLGSKVMRNYCTLQRDLFTYSFRRVESSDLLLCSSSTVSFSLGINVLLPFLDLPAELGLLTPGIFEVAYH